MNDLPEKLTPSERFVKCPVQLLYSGLPSLAILLWLAIQAHCIRETSCHPSTSRLAKLLGVSRQWISEQIQLLVRQGYLTVTRKGKSNVYLPMLPGHPVDVSCQPQLTCQLETTRQPETTLYVNSSLHHVSTTDDIEVDKGNRLLEVDLADTPKPKSQSKIKAPTKKSPKKSKAGPPKDPVTLQTLLDEIDLEPFRTKFRGVDIDAVWGRFSEVTLQGTGQEPGPNPYDYRDLKLAFGNWCRKDAEKLKAQQPPEPATNPAYRKFE